ncbi:MAG TPA: hypothetical protein VJR89_07780, partial [Polyangiales bacterium]|nr:hypothetical protein [Polyangiales bacterium]
LAADGHATTWNPGANGVVRALLTDGPTVYIGGDFTRLGAAARERIAQVDAASGLVTAWNPGADATVHALTRAGGAVIAGGAFENIGGAARPHLAALDAVSGGATSWTPAPDAPVRAVASYDGVLYVAGQFRSISDANRSIAAYDETFSLLDYAPVLDGAVFALSVGQVAHAGGDFSIAFAPLQLAR